MAIRRKPIKATRKYYRGDPNPVARPVYYHPPPRLADGQHRTLILNLRAAYKQNQALMSCCTKDPFLHMLTLNKMIHLAVRYTALTNRHFGLLVLYAGGSGTTHSSQAVAGDRAVGSGSGTIEVRSFLLKQFRSYADE